MDIENLPGARLLQSLNGEGDHAALLVDFRKSFPKSWKPICRSLRV
jgi:hypothetical protein